MSGELNGSAFAVLARLDALGIPYRVERHERVSSMDECAAVSARIGAVIPKNYFLAPRSGKVHFLALVRPEARLVTKELSRSLGVSRLMFAPEEDLNMVGCAPGALSPLGLMFDSGAVGLLMDETLKSLEVLAFHPCDNRATVVLRMSDFLEIYLPSTGHEVHYIQV